MDSALSFSILDSVDSTNNYAMGRVHAGLAKHGMAWFAMNQTAGKGQRSKLWESEPGMNIIMSITLSHQYYDLANTFSQNAAIAICVKDFLNSQTGDSFTIKWPNDIYWRDRKAGGILIENVIRGDKWLWSVIGIGINVNQVNFPENLKNPVSLKQITGKLSDPVDMARILHHSILQTVQVPADFIIRRYNDSLYKRGQSVKFKKGAIIFHGKVDHVDQFGQLHIYTNMEEIFNFGEVEWVVD